MGASTVAAEIIFFIVIVLASTMFLRVFLSAMDSYNASAAEQIKRVRQQMDTDIEISTLTIDGTTDELSMSVLNIGSTTLDANKVDIFVNGKFISRACRTITVEPSTELRNPGLWDPYERITIYMNDPTCYDFVSGETYYVRVETQYGVGDEAVASAN